MSNAQKIWLARSLNQIATARAQDAIQLLGKALPATIVSIDGSIATVNFEVLQDGYNLPQVTCPIAGSVEISTSDESGFLLFFRGCGRFKRNK